MSHRRVSRVNCWPRWGIFRYVTGQKRTVARQQHLLELTAAHVEMSELLLNGGVHAMNEVLSCLEARSMPSRGWYIFRYHAQDQILLDNTTMSGGARGI